MDRNGPSIGERRAAGPDAVVEALRFFPRTWVPLRTISPRRARGVLVLIPHTAVDARRTSGRSTMSAGRYALSLRDHMACFASPSVSSGHQAVAANSISTAGQNGNAEASRSPDQQSSVQKNRAGALLFAESRTGTD